MNSSTALKGKYVADVPVLLSPEHVTKSEYKRLKRYRDLMGWKQTEYERTYFCKACSRKGEGIPTKKAKLKIIYK